MQTHPNPDNFLSQAATKIGALSLTPVSPVLAQAITAHMVAVLQDEAQFDENGNAYDKDAAAKTLDIEFAAFETFCRAQCLTPSDVQAKITYILTGTQGERTPLSEYLYVFDGNGPQLAFMHSLVLGV